MNRYPYSLLNGGDKDDLHPNLPDVRSEMQKYIKKLFKHIIILIIIITMIFLKINYIIL